ncbi:pyridoxal-phosphate dependent enzyme [Phytoactinopolyspora alkaliphila]|uniref:Pyridoxal-phosphate dependent enzyme n=1 Tax=Phytoactinopolyspora alkaliphila TaxID=1783498 RepID=A0A6N9YIB4_9ACTN|nr:pyridoxal-phosphate dependent enzyme [Phytoactinopolyspora alkaliphila]NED94746.1 pyridoxal-phosphate dependent enzyme [Phytoactinopolyspora alkaliphila]
MSDFTGTFACVRCGAQAETTTPWTGCSECAAQGVHANILPVYTAPTPESLAPDTKQPGIFRYRRRLPVPDDAVPVSLHEGGTPLIDAGRLTGQVGVGQLWFKDQTRNPTWSYKDRLAAVAITVARAQGAETVALATTGNHGAAAAAYAAKAGLRCVVFTLESVPQTMKVLMQSYGAEVFALRTGPERWALLRQAVDRWGWVPISGFMDPPLGSNPYGVDGYKTLAYEIAADLGAAPDAVVVPAAYADGLAGIQRGFADLAVAGVIDREPRLVAVDPFGAYEAALAADPVAPARVGTAATSSFSIATPIATYQGLAALQATDGIGVGIPDDDEVLTAQGRIASSCGMFLEASSAICLPAVERLVKDGTLGQDSRVVCVATSTGLKDVGAAARRLPDVPVIDPELGSLEHALDHRAEGR